MTKIIRCWWCHNSFESHHRFEELCPPCQKHLDDDLEQHQLKEDPNIESLDELREQEHIELGED